MTISVDVMPGYQRRGYRDQGECERCGVLRVGDRPAARAEAARHYKQAGHHPAQRIKWVREIVPGTRRRKEVEST